VIKELVLRMLGITEDEAINEAAKIYLTSEEKSAYDSGSDFINKYNNLGDAAKRRVFIKIIAAELLKQNGGR